MSSVQWTVSYDPLHIWYWSTGQMANGWSALITDDSQAVAPKRPTRYSVSAVCRWWIVQYPKYLETLEEAKAAALRLVVMQKQACADPACRVEVTLA